MKLADIDLPAVLLALIVASTVAFLGVHVLNLHSQQEMQAQHEMAQAYCEQVFGDEDVIISNVVGNHGGYHCLANDGSEPHYHEVTQEARQAALEAQRNGEQVDWSTVDRYKDTGPWERQLQSYLSLLPVTVGVIGLVVGIGVIQRRRKGGSIEG
jgi:hypothetical protein